jgi:methionine synthase I (cobalamin-dependent)
VRSSEPTGGLGHRFGSSYGAHELDEGDPDALGAEHRAVRPRLSSVAVLGGCCGTDCRQVEAIGRAWMD